LASMVFPRVIHRAIESGDEQNLRAVISNREARSIT
jgi:hypothetical protein